RAQTSFLLQVQSCSKQRDHAKSQFVTSRTQPGFHLSKQIFPDVRVEVVAPRDRCHRELWRTLSQRFDRLRRFAKGHVVLDFDTAEGDKRRTGYAAEKTQVIVAFIGAVLLDVAGGGDDKGQRQLDVEQGRRLAAVDQLLGRVEVREEVCGLGARAEPLVGQPW